MHGLYNCVQKFGAECQEKRDEWRYILPKPLLEIRHPVAAHEHVQLGFRREVDFELAFEMNVNSLNCTQKSVVSG